MNQNPFYLGADPRNPRRLNWLSTWVREAHQVIVGGSGSGKSTLQLDQMGQDWTAKRGFASFDPKGDLYEDGLAAFSLSPEASWPSLASDLILVDAADPSCPARFNILEVAEEATPSRQRLDIATTFRRVWQTDSASAPRLTLVFRRAVHLAMDQNLTFVQLPRLLTDTAYRDSLLSQTDDFELRRFWESEFPSSPGLQHQWTAPVLTRLETFLDAPEMRAFLGSRQSSFQFLPLMNSSKVCMINLSQGALGKEVADLLGGFLISRLQLAAESRQRMSPEARRTFWIYCDEVQNLVDESFDKFLNEARGYGVSLVTANQHLAQLPLRLRQAILGNARLKVAFRVSADDAEILAPEFFRITGERVKEKNLAFAQIILPIPYYEYKYYSPSDESRQNREAMHYLEDRLMWAHIAGQPRPQLLRTVDVPLRELRGALNRVDRFRRIVYDVQRARMRVDDEASEPPREVGGGTPHRRANNGARFTWARGT